MLHRRNDDDRGAWYVLGDVDSVFGVDGGGGGAKEVGDDGSCGGKEESGGDTVQPAEWPTEVGVSISASRHTS